MAELGLASSIDAAQIDFARLEILVSRHMDCAETDRVNIADVGFGVSQILPVLVSLLAAEQGQIVYIEQPELHLHPKAQLHLAKVISAAVTERKIQVVIETHSAILICGVQILVAKGKLAAETVSLNWFTQDRKSGQTKISSASLDKHGAYGDWPIDFDDISLEATNQYLDAVTEAFANEV